MYNLHTHICTTDIDIKCLFVSIWVTVSSIIIISDTLQAMIPDSVHFILSHVFQWASSFVFWGVNEQHLKGLSCTGFFDLQVRELKK